MRGSLDMETQSVLERLLAGVHSEVLHAELRGVQVDCEGLYFANSSSLKRLVSWIMTVKRIEGREP